MCSNQPYSLIVQSREPMQDNSSTYHGDLLIVDDVADNLRVLSNILSNQGYRVRAVKNSAMALMGAKLVPPDVILLDIRMPEINGYEVCQQLKSDPQLCEIPIIFLSALDEATDKAKAFEVGGADYITKPFQMEEVLARVKNQLTLQRLKKEVAQQRQQLEQVSSASESSNLKPLQPVYAEMLLEITSILKCCDRLSQDSQLIAEQAAGLRSIHQSSQNLLKLVNQQLKDLTN